MASEFSYHAHEGGDDLTVIVPSVHATDTRSPYAWIKFHTAEEPGNPDITLFLHGGYGEGVHGRFNKRLLAYADAFEQAALQLRDDHAKRIGMKNVESRTSAPYDPGAPIPFPQPKEDTDA